MIVCMLSEYKLIDLDPKINNYQYKHHGYTGYEVTNKVTKASYLIQTIDNTAICNCSTFKMKTLPCRHLLFVMKSVVDLKPKIQIDGLNIT